MYMYMYMYMYMQGCPQEQLGSIGCDLEKTNNDSVCSPNPAPLVKGDRADDDVRSTSPPTVQTTTTAVDLATDRAHERSSDDERPRHRPCRRAFERRRATFPLVIAFN